MILVLNEPLFEMTTNGIRRRETDDNMDVKPTARCEMAPIPPSPLPRSRSPYPHRTVRRKPTSLEDMDCSICNDKATGKHYGAFSCDGCKGFFRRSIRKKHDYQCRQTKSCDVTKDRRNQCRFCRLNKCIQAGMRREAVQNERDPISRRHLPGESYDTASLTVANLLEARNAATLICGPTTGAATTLDRAFTPVAGLTEIHDSMNQQLRIFVEFAKKIPCFVQLSVDDKVLLLKSNAAEYICLGASHRTASMIVEEPRNCLLLGNNYVIPRDHQHLQPEVADVTNRVLDVLVSSFAQLAVDETEIVCLKAIVLFDPSVHGLQDVERVRRYRHQIQVNLEDYVSNKMDGRGRFGDILLTLTPLHAIKQEVVKALQLVKIINKMPYAELVEEMLLEEEEEPPIPFYNM